MFNIHASFSEKAESPVLLLDHTGNEHNRQNCRMAKINFPSFDAIKILEKIKQQQYMKDRRVFEEKYKVSPI